jgi:F420-0:gamma-glutamyl ligase-like protein
VFADRGLTSLAFPPDAFCPVDWWEAPNLVAAPLPDKPAMFAVHLWNEVWRHLGMDKDASFAPECAYEELKRRYPVLR